MPGAPPRDREDTAIVVLGCPLVHARGGALEGPLARRIRKGALEASCHEGLPVVVSGGRVWGDVVEADGMGEELCRLGVSPGRIVAERCSHSTRENARYTSALLARRGVSDVLLVTCDWHAPRAAALFRREGFTVRVAAAPSPRVAWPVRLWRRARERLLLWAFAVVSLVACKKPGNGTPQAPVEADAAPDLATIAGAEDRRRAREVPEAAGVSHDVRLRRRAAEALARIADADADAGLLRALEDEDLETVAWGAYGLGFSCRGKEEAHVKALASRAASLDVSVAVVDASPPRTSLDPRRAIARAVGRCGGALAGQVLAGWVRSAPSMAIPAAYGLGDVARASGLTDDAASALLDAASAAGPGDASLALLYPFGRVEHVTASAAPRVLELARRALARPSELRSFAIRALSRVTPGGADELERVVVSHDFSATERAEAARGLALLGEPGLSAAAAALGRLAPEKDPFAIAALGGDEYGVLYALLSSLGGVAPKDALPALHAIASLSAPGAPPPMLARRLSELRCLAAGALASGAYDLDVLQRCDVSPGSGVGERAKLAALVRRPLFGERRSLWSAMAKSPKVRLREDALEAIAGHAELGDVGRAALAEALASGLPGVVATAADVIAGHPDRVMALSAREIQRALDPASPPPTANPARDLDRAVATALDRALSRAWSEDLVETRIGLLDAASAVRLPAARAAAERACRDANAAVRDHASKALRALGNGPSSCVAPAEPREAPDASPLVEAAPPASSPALKRATTVTFESDAGELAIVFEPELAPVAASRFVELARRGFYDGILVHRVVPGFVAQFGDPEGDGYGGSGALLRCETSPVPFRPLDVGVALSGRDTGSSQIFVTLGRYPHLDGEYARVGHAEGDWMAVAEGDVIRHARVSD